MAINLVIFFYGNHAGSYKYLRISFEVPSEPHTSHTLFAFQTREVKVSRGHKAAQIYINHGLKDLGKHS